MVLISSKSVEKCSRESTYKNVTDTRTDRRTDTLHFNVPAPRCGGVQKIKSLIPNIGKMLILKKKNALHCKILYKFKFPICSHTFFFLISHLPIVYFLIFTPLWRRYNLGIYAIFHFKLTNKIRDVPRWRDFLYLLNHHMAH